MSKKTKLGFISCQYAEKPKPFYDKEALDSVPMSAANKKHFSEVSAGDANPFEFIQEVKFGEKYPATDGTFYMKSWAESYAKKANEVLIPGSKDGHTAMNAWAERVPNHLYVTGAKVEGESLLIRHYVTNKMPDFEYQKLIGEIKAGLISTSVVSMNEYDLVPGENGQPATWKAIKSMGRERNDLVEWDQTGMVSKMVATSRKDAIENIEDEGDTPMTYAELVAEGKRMIAENKTNHLAVMKDLGLEIDVLTEPQKADLAVMKQIRELAGTSDIVQLVSSSVSSQKTAFETLRDAAIQKSFGHNTKLLDAAKDHFSVKTGTQKDIDSEIDRIKELKSMKEIAGSGEDGRQNLEGGQKESVVSQKEIRCGDQFRGKGDK